MIKIKNIYYMLAYAYQSLKEDGYDTIASEEFENIHDLLASILVLGISSQIKRGLNRDYELQIESLSCLRGKIDVSSSIKQNTLTRRKMVCNFDVFSENTTMNQILKTTSMLLIHCSEVNVVRRKALKKLMLYFADVAPIEPYCINWHSLNFHRNNATYKLLMSICSLVLKGMLLTTESGEYKLAKYLDEQTMHRLYEKFVLGYYRREYPQFSVSASHIDWNIDDDVIDFLPQMKTDIMLTYNHRTIIIDTKYYSHSLQKNPQFDKYSIISGNLYQIFTYVKNKDRYGTGKVSGVLLYAKTDEEITPDNDYSMSGNRISVKTLDLNSDWMEIKGQLDGVAVPLLMA